MTLESKVIEAEKIEHIPQRGTNISRGLTISLLVHTFFVWAALGFPYFNFNNFFSREDKGPQQVVYVTLNEDYGSYPKQSLEGELAKLLKTIEDTPKYVKEGKSVYFKLKVYISNKVKMNM